MGSSHPQPSSRDAATAGRDGSSNSRALPGGSFEASASLRRLRMSGATELRRSDSSQTAVAECSQGGSTGSDPARASDAEAL